MNWSKKFKKSKPSDMEYSRLKRLLDELIYKKIELPEEGMKAVVCNDCIAIFNLDKEGYSVTLVPAYDTVSFDLNLTPKEMEEFNGGSGLRGRYFRFRKEIQEKYKQ